MSVHRSAQSPTPTRKDPAPRQVVVLSGKGGTGKTTIVASLAALASNKVLADCDVDTSDLPLLLDPREQRHERFVSGKVARIIPRQCSACARCADKCRFEAIYAVRRNGGRPAFVVDPAACEGCGLCARVCASGAVKMAEAERGEWFVSDTRHGPLVHARLHVGG
jgi:MinD superfamily P-loop ATPase